MTVIRKCTCKSEYQDKVYGVGNRFHNTRENKGRTVGTRCTVCGTKKDS